MTRFAGVEWNIKPKNRYYFFHGFGIVAELHHDHFWLFHFTRQRTGIRTSWAFDRCRWNKYHIEQWPEINAKRWTVGTWWRTLWYDGDYCSGDRVHLPPGETWKCGEKHWASWGKLL